MLHEATFEEVCEYGNPRLKRNRRSRNNLPRIAGGAPRDTPPTRVSYAEVPYNVNTTPRSTAAVSWQTGDVIVAMIGNEGDTLTAPTATGLTFIQQKNSGTGSFATAGVWTAVAGANGSQVVTGGTFASKFWGMSVWVFRGSDGVGVSFEAHTATSAATAIVSSTPTDTHSAYCWGVFDWGAGVPSTSVPTPTATNVNESAQETSTTYTAYVADLTDKASASATNFGITSGSASAGPFTVIGVEVLGTINFVADNTTKPGTAGMFSSQLVPNGWF